ncbi:MAG: hypothetical protein DI539_28200 [Flavobacterium psychrophilum]|nr:MAG: hypothetical protein DI539_28200 [Flavobacterium psychrophilum]
MPPLFFLLGFKGFEELMTALGLTQNTILQPMKLVDKFELTSLAEICSFIRTFEGYESRAYDLKDGRITIGYGSTAWLSNTGKVIRPVRMGDTIDEPTARQLVYNYFYPVIPVVDLYLSSRAYKIHPKLLAMLLQNLYGTGLGGVSYNFFKNSISLCNGITDLERIASIYYNETMKSLSSMKNYPVNKLGWTRRYFAASDFIRGNLRPKIWYDRNITKPWK